MKQLSIIFCLLCISIYSFSQGCSDAGFCTAGNFNSQHKSPGLNSFHKHEIDITFNYATHGKDERYYQPQLSYRLINRDHSSFEVRIPVSSVKNICSGISTTGIGDITTTYNGNKLFGIKSKFEYSVGLKISLSDASKKSNSSNISYPMYLQSGLGTTDFIAIVNYTPVKYVSVGTGLQLPFIQYNNNKTIFPSSAGTIAAEGYRRKPDALLRITGHYQIGKFKVNGTLLGIFHLADDYYKTTGEKYSLTGSRGTTLNYVFDCSYMVGNKVSLGLLYGSPFKTRQNIPDGLGRSDVISPKVTIAF